MATKWGDLLKEAGTTGGNFEPLPSGTYDAKIIKAEHKIAQSGKSMFVVQLQVTSGPHANRMVWNRFVVSPENPKALGWFFSNMRALGLSTEFFAAQPTDEQVVTGLLEKSCRIEVSQSEYNGAIRNEVTKVLPPESGAVSAPAPAVAAAPAVPTPTASVPTPVVTPTAPF
jgi:hypothetical protein